MKYFGLILALAFSSITYSSMSHASEYQDDIDNFFDLFQQGKVEEAVSSIYKSNPYVSSIPDQIINVKNQLSSLSGLVGKLSTINKIDTYKVGNSIVHVTYIATYERQPVRFEFQFFRVKEGWRIYSLSFDDSIDNEIKMLARKRALQSE